MVKCSRCGADNAVGMRFCTNCGASLEARPTPAARPSAMAPTPAGPGGSTPGPAPSPAPGGTEPPARRFGATAAAGTPALQRTMHEGPSAPSTRGAPARIVALLKDGGDGNVYPLDREQLDVGRTEGDVLFPDDPYLDARHARLLRRGDEYFLRDLDTVNGIYVRVREPVDLRDGDMVLFGQQVLRFETLPDGELPLGPATVHGVLVFGTPEVPRVARLVQYTTEGVGRDVHYLYRDQTVIGRENGDIVFPDDPFLSRRHAAVSHDRASRRFVLKDLGSSNGTALRFRGERRLRAGEQFRLGRHLFRFDLLDDAGAGPAAGDPTRGHG